MHSPVTPPGAPPAAEPGILERLANAGWRTLEATLVLALAAMVVMVFGNVVLRYAFNSGITVSEELSRWCFVWMTFVGALIGLREHAHLGTEMLLHRLDPRARRACLVLAQGLMAWLCWLLLKGSWVQTRINLDVEAPVTGAPVAILYGAGVFLGALAMPLLAHQIWRTWRGDLHALGATEDAPHDNAADGKVRS